MNMMKNLLTCTNEMLDARSKRNLRLPLLKELKLRMYDKKHHISTNWDIKSFPAEYADDLAHEYINKEPEKPKQGTDNSTNTYYRLAAFGKSINARLRKGVNNDDMDIINMVKSNHTKASLILYRGVCDDVYQKMLLNAKNISDVDYVERGFLCCSLVKDHHINEEICFRIFVPEGTPAAYMGSVSNEPGYYEVDVLCGCKLKIISIDNEFVNCKLVGFTSEYTSC